MWGYLPIEGLKFSSDKIEATLCEVGVKSSNNIQHDPCAARVAGRRPCRSG